MRAEGHIAASVGQPVDSSGGEGRSPRLTQAGYLAAFPFILILVAYLGMLGFQLVYDDPFLRHYLID